MYLNFDVIFFNFQEEKRVSAVNFKRLSKDEVEEAGRIFESQQARKVKEVGIFWIIVLESSTK